MRVCSELETFYCFRHSLKEHYQLFQVLKNTNSLLNIVFLRNCLTICLFCPWLGKWLCRENLGNFFRAAVLLRRDCLLTGVPEFKECVNNTPSHDWAAGSPVRSREEDLRILLGPFQREMLCDGASVCVCVCVLAGNRCSLGSALGLHWQLRWKRKLKVLCWFFF